MDPKHELSRGNDVCCICCKRKYAHATSTLIAISVRHLSELLLFHPWQDSEVILCSYLDNDHLLYLCQKHIIQACTWLISRCTTQKLVTYHFCQLPGLPTSMVSEKQDPLQYHCPLDHLFHLFNQEKSIYWIWVSPGNFLC